MGGVIMQVYKVLEEFRGEMEYLFLETLRIDRDGDISQKGSIWAVH